jgi:hypothetical protein
MLRWYVPPLHHARLLHALCWAAALRAAGFSRAAGPPHTSRDGAAQQGRGKSPHLRPPALNSSPTHHLLVVVPVAVFVGVPYVLLVEVGVRVAVVEVEALLVEVDEADCVGVLMLVRVAVVVDVCDTDADAVFEAEREPVVVRVLATV